MVHRIGTAEPCGSNKEFDMKNLKKGRRTYCLKRCEYNNEDQ